MAVEQVFRIRCDACGGWLSLPDSYVPGTDLDPEDFDVRTTAEKAALFDTPSRARATALRAGWRRQTGIAVWCVLETGRRAPRPVELADMAAPDGPDTVIGHVRDLT